jgi:hypothetical protein
MSRTQKAQEQVYAILRYDAFHGDNTPPEVAVTIKELVRSEELAIAEVARLNALNGESDVRYWYQLARLFPEGKSAGGTSD